MKATIGKLQKRQGEINARLTALNEATLEGENVRSFSDVEKKEYDELRAEFDANKSNLERLTEQNKRATAYINTQGINFEGEKGEKKKMQKRHSITKAVAAAAFPNNQRCQLSGLELEMHQEAENEARNFGRSIEGVGVPSFFMRKELMEERALTVGTPANGGNTVATDLGAMIPYLQPRLQVEALGATILTGLTSNLDLPKNDGISSATWEGETDPNAETAPTFSKKSLTPKRLGAYTDFSKQLLLQSNLSIDTLVTRQLERAIRIKLDSSAINGSGAGGEPEGILNMTGIGNVAMGTNGAVPTRAKLIDLISAIAAEDADMGRLAFLTTPGIRGQLQKTATDAGSGLFVWSNPEELLGYRAAVSTQVPSNLDKGTSSGVCHAILYGNWEEFIMAQWGGLDLVIDPYTKATTSEVRIVANSWWDFAAKHVKSFAAIQDALVS